MSKLGTIPGTTGTTFDVVASLSAGKVGFRPLSGSSFRVRVVPNGTTKLNLSGWSQPDEHQKRYSTVVDNQTELGIAIATATKALAEQSVQVSVAVA